MTSGDGDPPPLRRVAESRYTDFFPVGRGGMGIVYWALDTELSRQVAFKVIGTAADAGGRGATPAAPLELHTPDVSSPEAASFDGARLRFLQEAWVTGGMDHPGIVPVYELGETAGGVPYYTMRFVRGNRTLATAIDALAEDSVMRRLEELLEPFLKVCDTVRYAHNRGVIHRDLKPDNVALGEYGEVVVLDWGLARVRGALDTREDPWSDRVLDLREESGLKTVASALGTPGYMPPEAARGETEALDERGDVYALGVMFFQILTGRLPFRFTTGEEYTRQVLTQPAPDPAEVADGVPSRLAAICQGALAPVPDDRPASADAFAEALRAWRTQAALDREIDLHLEQATAALATAAHRRGEDLLRELDRITAACRRVLDLRPGQEQALHLRGRAETLRERGIQERERQARRRTLRRFGAVALGVGVVVAVVVAAMLEARREEAASARRQAELARARAEDDRGRAEDVMKFMVFELQESLEPIGRLDVLAKIGATAQEYYATLPNEGLSRNSLVGHTVTLRRLGEVNEARGDLPAAIEAYRLAAEVAGRILALDSEDAEGRYHRSLADARVATAVYRQGYSSDAKRMLLAHREDVLRLLAKHPDRAEYRDALAAAHASVGRALQGERRWEEAQGAYQLALDTERALEADHPEEERWTRRRLGWQLDLSFLTMQAGRAAKAVTLAERTHEECSRRRADPGLASDVRWLNLDAACLFRLARVASHLDPLQDRPWARAYETSKRLSEMDPENAAHQTRLALILNFRSECHGMQGKHEKALEYASEAYELCEDLIRKDPTNASWLNSIITLCDRVATLTVQLGLGVERDRGYRAKAADHAERLVTLDPTDPGWRHLHAYTLGQLGRTWTQDDPTQAQRLLERCLEITSDLLEAGPDSYELVVLRSFTRQNLASLHVATGRRDPALGHLRRSIDELHRFWTIDASRYEVISHLLMTHRALATALARGGADERREAQNVLRASIALGEKTLSEAGEEGPLIRTTVGENLATLRAQLEELTSGEAAPR